MAIQSPSLELGAALVAADRGRRRRAATGSRCGRRLRRDPVTLDLRASC